MSSFSHGLGAITATACSLLALGPRFDRQGPLPVTANVRTITADFRAVSASGSPLADLTAGDVTVTVAGQRRVVRSLELVRDVGDEAAVAEGVGPKTPPAPALPAPFATNAKPGRGRTFYLLVDEESMTPGDRGSLQSMIAEFLTNLPAADEVALATVQPGGENVHATTDRARVRGAVDGLTDMGSVEESPVSADARSAGCLLRLRQLLGTLAGSQPPPVIVVISAGLSVPRPVRDTAIRAAGSRQTASGPGSQRGAVVQATLGQIRSAAANSRAELYFVQLPGQRPGATTNSVAGGPSDADREAALRVIARDIGGDVLPLLSADNVFIRIARETGSHYVVSLDGSDGDRPGVAYPIAIATNRAGAVLRVRPDVFLGGPVTAAPPAIQEMLAGVDEFRQLPIRLAGFTSRAGARGSTTVLVTSLTEPVDSTVRFTSATAVLLDAAGARVAERTAESSGLSATPLVSELLAPPGHYRLRVAVIDAEGRPGTAEYPLDAGLTRAGPLTLSSLGIGVAGPPAPPGRSRSDSVSGPEPRLEFTNEIGALAFFDLYGGTPNEHVTLVMDVLKRADGPPIQQLEPQIRPARASEPDHYLVTAPVDLTELPPGDYLVRATAGVTGQAPATITRTLRKVKAGPPR